MFDVLFDMGSTDLVLLVSSILIICVVGFITLYFIAVVVSFVLRLLWWFRGFVLGTAVALYLNLEMPDIVIAALIGGVLVFVLSRGRNGRPRALSRPATSTPSSSGWWPWSDVSAAHSDHKNSNPLTINPSTGLPMIGNSNVDVGGNTFGSGGHDTTSDHSTGMDSLHDGF